MRRRLWPPAEAAQSDYEALRQAAVAGRPLLGVAAARFERAGLAGLIARPLAPPLFSVVISGAVRPAWTPYGDPRTQAMIEVYELLLGAGAALADEVIS